MEVVLVGRGVLLRELALFLVALTNRRKMKASQVSLTNRRKMKASQVLIQLLFHLF